MRTAQPAPQLERGWPACQGDTGRRGANAADFMAAASVWMLVNNDHYDGVLLPAHCSLFFRLWLEGALRCNKICGTC